MLNGSRIGKWVAGGLGALVLLVALLLYTPPGLTLVGRMVSPLSGGAVRVERLGGFFPNRLHAARLTIADSGGVWLQIEQPSLRWSALSFVSNHIAAREISAARITVLRRPISSGATGQTPRLDIEKLSFPRIVLARSDEARCGSHCRQSDGRLLFAACGIRCRVATTGLGALDSERTHLSGWSGRSRRVFTVAALSA